MVALIAIIAIAAITSLEGGVGGRTVWFYRLLLCLAAIAALIYALREITREESATRALLDQLRAS
jgi:hypothetical protein